jgi:hypothetical protein
MRYLELVLIDPWACLLILGACFFMKKNIQIFLVFYFAFRGVDPYM